MRTRAPWRQRVATATPEQVAGWAECRCGSVPGRPVHLAHECATRATTAPTTPEGATSRG